MDDNHAKTGSEKKRKRITNDYETELDTSKPRKIPRTLTEKDGEKRLIVILENASLETVKVLNHHEIIMLLLSTIRWVRSLSCLIVKITKGSWSNTVETCHLLGQISLISVS